MGKQIKLSLKFMDILPVITYGVVIGFIASEVRGSGFGLWWDIYLGVAGATFASLIMVYGYFFNFFPTRDVVGLNLHSVGVDIIGALGLIYIEQLYNKINSIRQIRYNNLFDNKNQTNLYYSR